MSVSLWVERARALALGGVLGPALFTAAVIAGGLARPGYSHVRQFISELGAAGTPNAALFNVGGFVPAGLLLIGFGVATARLISKRRSIVAASAMTIFGLRYRRRWRVLL